jgi:uncharacterized repeat protein (TIGR03803 family)
MRSVRLFKRLATTLPLFAVMLLVSSMAAQQESVLYSFNNNGTDGFYPFGGMVSDASGNFYGTTMNGGANCGPCGTVFELSPEENGDWSETILHTFGVGADGSGPRGNLIFDASGNLFGTTLYGGANSEGTVYELTPSSGGVWTETVLYSFNPFGKNTGYAPNSGVILDAVGNLYGTTTSGGTGNCYHGCGTVFQLTPSDGSWTETTLYNFGSNNPDGHMPESSLLWDAAGNLYGTTYMGGVYNGGTVFELTPTAGGVWDETVLYNFSKRAGGYNPVSSLIFDSSGNLYGTTYRGGDPIALTVPCPFSDGCGTVFELSPSSGGTWTENVLHSFVNNGSDGFNSESSLIFDTAGNLYGTTAYGGAYNGSTGGGIVFELTPTGGHWIETVLCRFNSVNGAGSLGSLLFDQLGNLFGTTNADGAYNFGMVFEIIP